MTKSNRFNLVYFVLASFGILIGHELLVSKLSVHQVPYSELQQLLRDKQVKNLVVGPQEVRGELVTPRDGRSAFVTTRVEPSLAAELEKHGVKYEGQVVGTVLPVLLSWVVPTLLFFGLWMLLARRLGSGQGGLMAIGKSKAKVYVETDTKKTFADVAGVEEAKDELRETVEFLRDPKGYGRLGARMPKGILLVGPPGTGKTLLAKAVAGEAGVPFFSISGSEFVEMFVGVGAARVRDLFEQARQKAPCIIFIDELDALGRARHGAGTFGGHDEKEQTLNQLLVELDGFDPTTGIVLLAATNRPEVLDAALLRAGRFDRQVLVDRPDKAGRLEILRVHSKGITMSPDVALGEVAAITPGFSGADLANLVNEAALAATRRRSAAVELVDFTEALERIVAGLERRNRLLNPSERKTVAVHEVGHAFVAAALGADPVHKVSIIPRGVGALGYTIQRPTEDRFLMTERELRGKMAVLLGGRAAELVVLGETSTGAADDLVKCTDIARAMVTRYAMVTELGAVSFEGEPQAFLSPGAGLRSRLHSEQAASAIDAAVRSLCDGALAEARQILEQNRAALEETAAVLLERETLEGESLAACLARVERAPALPDARRPAA